MSRLTGFQRCRNCLPLLLVAALLSSCASPYAGLRETSDPWQLIYLSRERQQQGRPRAAIAFLEKALQESEKLDRESAHYLHTKATVLSGMGRSYEQAGQAAEAEQFFLQAMNLAQPLPYRAIKVDLNFNLAVVRDEQGDPASGCRYLAESRRFLDDLEAHPTSPPDGYGSSEIAADKCTFLRGRIKERAKKMNCGGDR
jgi:tetratricopeptide (TPR) repeat protein